MFTICNVKHGKVLQVMDGVTLSCLSSTQYGIQFFSAIQAFTLIILIVISVNCGFQTAYNTAPFIIRKTKRS